MSGAGCPTREMLASFVDLKTTDAEADVVIQHLDFCPECVRRIEALASEPGPVGSPLPGRAPLEDRPRVRLKLLGSDESAMVIARFRRVTVGRDADCQLRLSDDRNVSRFHCRLDINP